MDKFIVVNKTGVHFLRGTVWTSDIDRATLFSSESEATEAISKSARFNPKGAKGATIKTV